MSKIRIDKKIFSVALAVGSSMSGRSKTLPILDTAKIAVKGNTAIISSYDMEVAITKRTSVLQSDEDFVFCVNGKDFLNIIRSINDAEISIEINEKTVTVYHAKGETSLPIFDADEFPKPVMDDNGKELIVDAQSLYNLLGEAKGFCGNDPLRPILTCVNIYAHNGVLGVFASDGTALYNNEYADKGCENMDLSFNIQSKAIDAVLNAINKVQTARINIGERNIRVSGSDAAVIVTMVEGRYPNARAIIPTTHRTIVSLSKSELLESIKRASLTCNQTTAIIKFKVSGDSLDISSQDIDFSKKTHETIACTCDGQYLTIGMKSTLVVNALSVLYEDVAISFNDNRRAAVWKNQKDDGKIVLIMPALVED